MAKPTKTDAVWHTLDTDALPPPILSKYDAYKEAYKAMKAERLEFETALAKAIDPPKGKRVIFGYNFGKLSVAVVDDDAKAKAKPATTTLADLVRR